MNLPKSYTKVTITQVKKKIKETGKFKGFAVANKVSPAHFFGGYAMAVMMELKTAEEVDKYRDNMMANMPKQLGNNVAWYKEN